MIEAAWAFLRSEWAVSVNINSHAHAMGGRVKDIRSGNMNKWDKQGDNPCQITILHTLKYMVEVHPPKHI